MDETDIIEKEGCTKLKTKTIMKDILYENQEVLVNLHFLYSYKISIQKRF